MLAVLRYLGKTTEKAHKIPKNGISLRRDDLPIVIVNGMQTNRNMSVIIHGGPGKECAFPSTVLTVDEWAFEDK